MNQLDYCRFIDTKNDSITVCNRMSYNNDERCPDHADKIIDRSKLNSIFNKRFGNLQDTTLLERVKITISTIFIIEHYIPSHDIFRDFTLCKDKLDDCLNHEHKLSPMDNTRIRYLLKNIDIVLQSDFTESEIQSILKQRYLEEGVYLFDYSEFGESLL